MDSSTATLNNSTVSGNTALDGGGIFSGASVSTVVSTIVGDNVASTAPDLNNSSSFLNISNSLVEDASGNGLANGVYNNIVGLDPQLDPNGLQDNGGSTQTIALLPISPAIDAGSNPNGLSSDQRGADRTIGAGTDIGAFEVFGSSAIVVDTLEDSMDGDFSEGDRSLREALEFISAGGHITFASNLSNQTITLNGSELLVSREVTIDGESNNITLDANSTSRVLRIDDGDSSNAIAVSIAGLTITGGSVSGYGGGILNLESLSFSNSNVLGNTATLDGGGIFNDFSIANISDSTVSGNVARDGGGIFNNSSTATVSYSTISGNSANGIGGGTFGGTGGGIRNRDSTLTVSNSTISNNSIRSDGGGIFSIRSFSTVNNSTVSGNSARSDGGGIFNVDSTSAVSNSTISGNTANDGGGGVFNQSSTSTISGSTISRNLSRKDGGGIHNRSSSNSTVSNSTVFDNTALFDGGGIYSRSSTLTLQNSTVSSNSAVRDTGGGIYMRSSASSIVSTIIGDNTASAAPDLSTSFGTLSISNSLVEDVSGNGLVNGNDGNIVGLDPNLDPSGLQNNGGTTETVALLSTSPAIDAGSNPNNLGADQRGKARTVGAVTDIGAFEFNAAPSITSAPIANVPENQTFAIDVQATDDNDVEGAGLTYSISGGDDASAFAIDVSTGVVTFLNAPDFENPTDANGDNVFELQVAVTDSGGLTASQDITINLNDLGDFWFTLNRNTNGFGNVEDIVQFDGVSTFGLFFDGSDVGLGGANVNAFDIISSTEILMSFGAPLTISGLGAVDDSDIVKFTATSLGEGTTAGTFDLFLDGDAVGLTSNGEDIDAIAGLPDGSLLLSTVGGARWGNGLRTKDEDLVRYDPISGSLALEFDGSDVGLTASGEDVDAAGFQNGRLQFSTNGNFSVPGISGFDEDIFSYTPSSSGGNTSGLFDTSLFFEGNQFGLARDIVGADFSIG
ncbi:MAG: cadherin repeat domain-containing protein [Cyanobacteria bacterium J06639_1]